MLHQRSPVAAANTPSQASATGADCRRWANRISSGGSTNRPRWAATISGYEPGAEGDAPGTLRLLRREIASSRSLWAATAPRTAAYHRGIAVSVSLSRSRRALLGTAAGLGDQGFDLEDGHA
jgi:hypothetical protein